MEKQLIKMLYKKLVDESNSKNTNYKYYNASGGELIAYG